MLIPPCKWRASAGALHQLTGHQHHTQPLWLRLEGIFCFLNLDWTECYKACFRGSVLRQCYMAKGDAMFFFFNQ